MFKKTRLFSAGDLYKSKGGIYNPSVIVKDNEILCILRTEEIPEHKRKNWLETSGQPWIAKLNSDLTVNEVFDLCLNKFPEKDFRVEDFRLFKHDTHLCASHPFVIKNKVYQAVSVIKNDIIPTFTIVALLESPFNQTIEKNWGFFTKNDQLYVLYSISPWLIYKVHDDWSLELVTRENYYGEWEADTMLSISTHPIEYEGNYLTIVHSRVSKQYIQGAVIFDKETFLPKYYTKEAFLKGGKEKGIRPNVLYVSGILEKDNTIHLFYGEGDTHSSIYSIDKNEFNKLIYKNKI